MKTAQQIAEEAAHATAVRIAKRNDDNRVFGTNPHQDYEDAKQIIQTAIGQVQGENERLTSENDRLKRENEEVSNAASELLYYATSLGNCISEQWYTNALPHAWHEWNERDHKPENKWGSELSNLKSQLSTAQEQIKVKEETEAVHVAAINTQMELIQAKDVALREIHSHACKLEKMAQSMIHGEDCYVEDGYEVPSKGKCDCGLNEQWGRAQDLKKLAQSALSPSCGEKSKTVTRKAFICTACEGVTADEPVTSCDCCPPEDKFIEGTITYPMPVGPEEKRGEV